MDKILIVKTGATGDVLRTSVLLHILKGEIYWITRKYNIALFPDAMPDVTFIPEENIPTQLFSIRFDLVINLEEDIQLAEKLSFLHAKQVVGVYWQEGRLHYSDDSAEWFDMSLISRYPGKANELKKRNEKTYQQLIYGMLGKLFSGEKYISYKNHTIVSSRGTTVGIEERVGQTWRNKAWYGYPELISMLSAQHYDVRVFEKRQDLRAYMDDIHSCNIVISGDTLAMHIALAYRIPSIALFNCTSAEEIYDYGVLRKIKSPLLQQFFYQRERIEEVIRSIPIRDVYEYVLQGLRSLPVK